MTRSRSSARLLAGSVKRRITILRRPTVRRLPSFRALIAVTLVLATLATAGIYVGMQVPNPPRLYRFNSYADLVRFVSSHHPAATPYSLLAEGGVFATGLTGSTTRGTAGYSTTNVQVEGVDEPDFVKTDGTYIYTIRNEDVLVLRAYPPTEAAIVATVRPGGEPEELLIYNSTRLVVISRTYAQDQHGSRTSTGFVIEVFDISLPDQPKPSQRIALDGVYLGGRLIGEYVYAVANSPVQDASDQVVLPSVTIGNEDLVIPAETIYYDPGSYDYYFLYTLAIALDIADPAAVPDIETFLGGSSGTTIYASLSSLYIGVSQYPTTDYWVTSTAIHRFSISDGCVDYVGSGEVDGYLINQFALDEYNGCLRVATASFAPTSGGETGPISLFSMARTRVNNVYILDLYLNVVGRLEGLAPGELLYSVRFLGDTGYLVTFLNTDPLFVVDLRCPQLPRLLGQLEVTGYSDYLHPLGDHQLLGIGKDAVPAGESFAWYAGVKLSLFNTTNPCLPTERARLVLGVRGTDSEALRDHKAVLIDSSRSLLVIPVLLAEYAANETDPAPPTYGECVTQGAFVFQLEAATATLTLRGVITHLVRPFDAQFTPWSASPFFVTRALYIGDVLYTLSQYKLAFSDLASLAPIGEIILSPGLAAA
jgi:inhibitor of cysteine peptidase